LNDDHVAIEFPHQSGKSRAGTIVEILPLILQKHLANREKDWIPHINAEKILL
jgi:hypothetical protein